MVKETHHTNEDKQEHQFASGDENASPAARVRGFARGPRQQSIVVLEIEAATEHCRHSGWGANGALEGLARPTAACDLDQGVVQRVVNAGGAGVAIFFFLVSSTFLNRLTSTVLRMKKRKQRGVRPRSQQKTYLAETNSRLRGFQSGTRG